MKVILRGYGVGMNAQQRQVARSQAADMTRVRGTSQAPDPPRDIICQSASNGMLVTWNYPPNNKDIQRWRVYKDNESTLFSEIKDRGTRQCFVNTTAGNPSPTTNVFITSLNSLGVESAKVQAQGQALTSMTASTVPTAPPEYNDVDSGGADLSTDYQ